jgi:hypothetical protein
MAEATFQTHFGALPSMTAAVKTLHNRPGTRTLQLGLEEFQEGDFDDAVRRMYAFFGFEAKEVRVSFHLFLFLSLSLVCVCGWCLAAGVGVGAGCVSCV